MTDRELLEAAAKAMGLHVDVRSTVPDWLWVRESTTCGPYRQWNPLTDDGDALRLTVKLGITVQRGLHSDRVFAGINDELANEKLGADPYFATRRAIVRAAAAMVLA